MSLLDRLTRKPTLPRAEDALPGRGEAIPTAERHFVSGRALRGPYPERIALVVMPAGVAVAVAITGDVWRTRSVLQYFI